MPVPLGKAIRWSLMSGDKLLDLATPSEEDIAEAREMTIPALRQYLEARLKPVEDDIIDNQAAT